MKRRQSPRKDTGETLSDQQRSLLEDGEMTLVDGVPFTPAMLALFSKTDAKHEKKVSSKEDLLAMQVNLP